ncbi:MAG: cysteine peptidase family C39 domain-containing protein [Methanosarcinales archaeon]
MNEYSTFPPYIAQERSYTCTVACIRMILKHYQLNYSEKELIKLFKVSPTLGTSWTNIASMLPKLGFSFSIFIDNTLYDLLNFIQKYPIVSLRGDLIG